MNEATTISAGSYLEFGSAGWDEFDDDGHIWPTETCAVADPSCDEQDWEDSESTLDPEDPNQVWKDTAMDQSSWWEGGHAQDPDQVWDGETAVDQGWEDDVTTQVEKYPKDPDQVWDGETAVDQGWEDDVTTHVEKYPKDPDQVWDGETAVDKGWEDDVATQVEKYPQDPDQVWDGEAAVDQGWEDNITTQVEKYPQDPDQVWDGETVDEMYPHDADHAWTDTVDTGSCWGDNVTTQESWDHEDPDQVWNESVPTAVNQASWLEDNAMAEYDCDDQDIPKTGRELDQWWSNSAADQDLQWGLVDQPDVDMSDDSQVTAEWWSGPSPAGGAENHALGWGSGNEDESFLATKVAKKDKDNQKFLRELDAAKGSAPKDPDI